MAESSAGGVYRGLLFPRRIVRFASRVGFVLIAGIFLLVAGYRLTQLWLIHEVTIAVPETEPGYQALFSKLASVIEPGTLKIRTASLPDPQSVAAALEQGKADFAVIRPDIGLPRNGLSAALLREDPIVVISVSVAPAPPEKASDKPPEKAADKKQAAKAAEKEAEKKSAEENEKIQLTGKRVGVVADDADRDALIKVLAFYGASVDAVDRIDDKTEAVRAAVVDKRVDAIAMVGARDRVRRLLNGLADFKPTIVPLSAAALTSEMPMLGQMTISARSLNGSLPAEDVQTVSVVWRLVARKNAERATVSALLQGLFVNRLELARESDLAWAMKGLEDEGATFAKLPNHRGALDYYNREQQTFMDLYGDWLWLGLFAAGGVSSALAWLIQLLSRRRQKLVEHILDRLLEILGEAREAQTVKALDELTLEVDGLVTHAVRQARWRASDPISTTALTLAINSSRAAITDRRSFFLREVEGAQKPVRKVVRQS